MPSRARLAVAALIGLTIAGCTTQRDTSPSPMDSSESQSTTADAADLIDLAPGLEAVQDPFSLPAAPVSSPGPDTAVTVNPSAGSTSLATANVGLSFEVTDLADERWDPDKSTLDELVGALDQPSLRFGGNSVDRRMWWTSTGEPTPDWAEVTLTPADFERLGEFAGAVDATVTLVVDLGHNDPQRAADYVFYAKQALGERLIAIAVGNEPNGFALASQPQYQIRPDGWGPQDYLTEATAYEQAIRARVPDIAIVGPGAFDAPWWRAFAEAKIPDTVALGQHWYPLWSCDAVQEPRAAPTPANLVSPWLHERANFIVGMGISTGADYGLPVWLEETGPTSCAGTNDSSRTHAQALWTVDFTLNAALLGVQRANQHGTIDACAGGAPMSPVCDTGELDAPTGVVQGQANYLAMLLVARLREGPFMPVAVQGDGMVYGYAVSDDEGIDVVLVNLNDPATVGSSPLTFSAPEGYQLSDASLLYGASLTARNESKLIPWSPASAIPASVPAGSVLALRLSKG
ncbi:hypothetical protein EK0264_15100 [Epidermidibacterium keratini]|uniref:Uncharacterized protein n=1 Tax=Epidermidibacterium keratini TaxID=1891644 RepID=A0A7L4YQF6_9ACTN|nr:hypothetical protein [Epidermidibacterium keratini]QHC01485.1 hypothetical protein EK0264_15100 [Epidermidibacterium keratini]